MGFQGFRVWGLSFQGVIEVGIQASAVLCQAMGFRKFRLRFGSSIFVGLWGEEQLQKGLE